MQNYHDQFIINEMRREKMLRQAENWRLTRKKTRRTFYGPALVLTGRILLKLGCWLQERYGTLADLGDLHVESPSRPRAAHQ